MKEFKVTEADLEKVNPISDIEREKFRSAVEFVQLMFRRRNELGMTFKDLSEKSGLSVDLIESIESYMHLPTDEERSLLYAALDIVDITAADIKAVDIQ